MKMKIRKTGLILFSSLLVLVLFASCAASSAPVTAAASAAPAATEVADYEVDYAPVEDALYVAGGETGGEMVSEETAVTADAAMEAPAAEPGMTASGLVVQQGDGDRKIVITVELGLQTKNFDAGVQDITGMTAGMGGYIQNSYVSGSGIDEKYIQRSATYTARIPTDRLNEFLETVTGTFHVIHQQQSADDISMNYYDTESRLKSLRVQEERLMAMLEQSGELDDLLRIEKELAGVLYEIESYASSLNRMDDSVDMSTVIMSLYEVVEYEEVVQEPATFGERVSETLGDSWEAFRGFCEGAVLFLIALVPFLPLFAVIAVVVILIVRRAKKRAAMRPQPVYQPIFTMPQPPRPEPPSPEDDPERK